MSRKEKSAWLLDTAEADLDYQPQNERSLPAADEHVNEAPKLPEVPMDFGAMREQFALRGHVLTRSRRVSDGCITFIVTRWEMHRAFASLPDLHRYLNQVMGAPL
jgi:hypothetical protein